MYVCSSMVSPLGEEEPEKSFVLNMNVKVQFVKYVIRAKGMICSSMVVDNKEDTHIAARRPCPDMPFPGGNALINYPCPNDFRFPVTGDFGVETYMGTNGIKLNMSGQIDYKPSGVEHFQPGEYLVSQWTHICVLLCVGLDTPIAILQGELIIVHLTTDTQAWLGQTSRDSDSSISLDCTSNSQALP